MATALGLALFTAAPPASAWCRLTTCQPTDDCKKDENGCPAEGRPLIWTRSPIPYRLHGHTTNGWDYKKLTAVIDAAFKVWTDQDCGAGEKSSLAFERGEVGPNQADFPFTISVVNEGWPFDESALAQTTHDFGKDTGTIKGVVIQINTAMHDFTLAAVGSPTALTTASGADLESVLVHEVGHYIGLAHSRAPGSIMAPTYCEDEDRCKSDDASRKLGDDDIAALCMLFPPARLKPNLEDPPPANVTSFGCTEAPASGSHGRDAAPFAALLAVALVSVRRRLIRR